MESDNENSVGEQDKKQATIERLLKKKQEIQERILRAKAERAEKL